MEASFAVRSTRPDFVVVDDFFADPDGIREFALGLNFLEDSRYYRGKRSDRRFLAPSVKEQFERLVQRPITKWEAHPVNGVFQYCVGGEQQVFHSDHQQYAAVVYLTPNAPVSSGTWLVRSKATGLRIVTAESAAKINMDVREAEQLTYKGKLLDPTAWEIVDVIGNVYNRMVLWNARLIHAAGHYFGTDVTNGRLFQIYFFDAE